jgi:hypothetical protein
MRVVHDRHQHALVTRQQWHEVLESVGFVVTIPPVDEAIHETQVVFLGVRPA